MTVWRFRPGGQPESVLRLFDRAILDARRLPRRLRPHSLVLSDPNPFPRIRLWRLR